jgi:hypothetical protein
MFVKPQTLINRLRNFSFSKSFVWFNFSASFINRSGLIV